MLLIQCFWFITRFPNVSKLHAHCSYSLCSEPTTELSLWQTLRQISCSHSQSKSKNFTIEVFQSWNRLSAVAHWLTASQSRWADDWQKAEWIHLTVCDISLCMTSLLSENLVILYFKNNIIFILNVWSVLGTILQFNFPCVHAITHRCTMHEYT